MERIVRSATKKIACFIFLLTITNVISFSQTITSSDPTGINAFCVGNTTTLTLNGIVGACTWDWYLNGNLIAGTTNLSQLNINLTSAGTFNYSVQGTCSGLPATIAILVSSSSPTNTVQINGCPTYACANSSFTLTHGSNTSVNYLRFDGPPGMLFNGSSSPAFFLMSVSSIVISVPALQNGTTGWAFTVTPGNGCGQLNSIPFFLKAALPRPSGFSGPTCVCGLTTATYSIGSICSNCTTSSIYYLWTAPAGVTISSGQGTNSIGVTINNASLIHGSLCVQAYMTGCQTQSISPSHCTTISNRPLCTLNGSAYACPGDVCTFSITGITCGSNLSYLWSTSPASNQTNLTKPYITSGGTSSTAQVRMPVPFTGTVAVRCTVTSDCGNGPNIQEIKNFSVRNRSTQDPGAIVGGIWGICSELGSSYCLGTPLAGASSYIWGITPGSGTIPPPGNNSCITVDFSASQPDYLQPATISIQGVFPRCDNQGNCLTATSSLEVHGEPGPPSFQMTISGNQSPCNNAVESYLITQGIYGATSYNWTVPANWTLLSGNGTNNVVYLVGPSGGDPIIVTPSNSCGNGPSTVLPVSVACRTIGQAHDIENKFSFYVKDQKTLVLYLPNPNDEASSFKLIDVNGRKIMERNFSLKNGENKMEIDISGIAKGIYLIEINNNNNSRREKILIN